MSHAVACLQRVGYKQILAPSPEADAPTPHLRFSLVWPLLYKLGIAQDWQRTKLTLQALALLLVKPQRSASGKAFRDAIVVPLLSSLWVSLGPVSGVSMKELKEL